ncbi:TPA: hypothetical protein JD264_22425 [Serratia fonticola]|nr:hypothetical protein [Serratia fonticola]
MSLFFNEISRGNLTPPTKYGFDREKWDSAWHACQPNPNAKDVNIYNSGVLIYEVLSSIRSNIDNLFKQAPNIDFESLLLALIALSNREITVAMRRAYAAPTLNIYNVMLKNDMTGEFISLQEIAHGVIDGFQIAINDCVRNIAQKREIITGEEPIDVLDFIKYEVSFSQLYSLYEHLWQCIFWSEYQVSKLTDENGQGYHQIKQPDTEFEKYFLTSVGRKEKLSAQKNVSAGIVMKNYYEDYYLYTKREGKKRVFLVGRIKDADESIKYHHVCWCLDLLKLEEDFPKEWFDTKFNDKFSIRELLMVFQQLSLLSLTMSDKYPLNDSALNVKKLMEFNIQLPAEGLHLALTKITSFRESKIASIMDFLCASKDHSDLWCHPIVMSSAGKYSILSGALNSPSIVRLVEHWLVTFKVDLSNKGYEFEQKVISDVNNNLRHNRYLKENCKAVSKRIKTNAGEEEFDFLLKIGDLVIIGELKSIVTTDSEISKYRTSEVLHKAGVQVERKANFFSKNTKDVFDAVGWEFDDKTEYKVSKVIVSNNGIFAGYKFNGIPVVDNIILNSYFKSSMIRLITMPTEDGMLEDLAWYQLYETEVELINRFSSYIDEPPQLNLIEDQFDYNEIRFPRIDDESLAFSKVRMFLKKLDIKKIMERPTVFKLIKSDSFESKFNEDDFIF